MILSYYDSIFMNYSIFFLSFSLHYALFADFWWFLISRLFIQNTRSWNFLFFPLLLQGWNHLDCLERKK